MEASERPAGWRALAWIGLSIVVGVVAGGIALADPQKTQGVIDFEGLAEGQIVDEVSAGSGVSGSLDGVIKVFGFNPDFGLGTNAAMVFDSSCPPTFTPGDCSGEGGGGVDDDLGTPNEAFKFKPQSGPPLNGPGVGDGGFPSNKNSEGKIVMISEDLDGGDPNDADNMGMYVEFDFGMVDGDVTVNSVSMLDIEAEEGEDGTFIDFFTDGSVTPTDMISIPPTGDNGRVDIDKLKLEKVDKMVVNLNGSGALLNVVFGAKEEGTCWSTSGGFQNAGFANGGKDYTFGGNVGPPPSGVWEVVDHVTGDNFHSNDVEVVECLVIDALTGPEQPGGNKGLEENLLIFKGTGRLRDGTTGEVTEGHPFSGCVIDSGEPAGKQGLDKDYFEIVVCDNGETDCLYGSGVCSVDTESGDLDPTGPQDACDALGDPVVFAACGALDGGNFQIHPPVGKPS